MSTALQAIETVRASAKAHCSPSPRIAAVETDWPMNTFTRQGDVYIRRTPLTLKSGPAASPQLAPGDTVGSRHIVRMAHLTEAGGSIIDRPGDVLRGPEIYAPHGFIVDHPTHPQWDCRLPGNYEVHYPRDLSSTERQRRAD